jgi:cell division protein FtsQ
MKKLVFGLCALLLIEGFVYFVVRPGEASVNLAYVGLEQYGEADIQPLLKEEIFQNWLLFDVKKAATKIAGLSGVQSVSVEKHFPASVVIQVRERVPVAMTLATVDNRTVTVFVDESGAVFTGGAGYVPKVSVPLLSGLTVEAAGAGMRLPRLYQPLLEQLSFLRDTANFAALSEIRVREKDYGTYDLELFPLHCKTHVLLDKGLNEAALHYMMVVLDVVNSLKPEVPVIDLRYGSASFVADQTRRL